MDLVISAVRSLRFRGKYRLMSRLAPARGVRAARIFGYRMNLDLGDWIQRNVYLGSYEQRQTNQLLSYLRPGMTFVDIGANVGYYSAMASSMVGNGRVISYEPNPYAFERLTGWVAANDAKNVTPVCTALGSQPGSITTYFGDTDNHTASLVPETAPDTPGTTVVKVTTLDAEAERLAIGNIDAMKIDVDGYETEVLKGCSQLMEKGRIRAVLCEFSAEWLQQSGSSSAKLEGFFESKGFVKRGVFGTEILGDRWFVRS
jgi:FkbM family methyltransferase